MNALVGADIISIAFLIVLLAGLQNKSIKTRSSAVFSTVCFANILCCATDAARYQIQGPGVPVWLIHIMWILAYLLGDLALTVFIYYCYVYIREKKPVNTLLYYVPVIILAITCIYQLIVCLSGKAYSISDGFVTVNRGSTDLATIVHMLLFIFLPMLAVRNAKEAGLSNIWPIGTFGMLPFLASVSLLLNGGDDYSYPAEAVTLLIIYLLVENQSAFEQEEKQRLLLKEKNRELEEISVKQEAQLEEISKLNKTLVEQGAKQEERYNIIQAMNEVYFASYYINLVTDTYTEFKAGENIREVVRFQEKAQDALNLACENLIVEEHQEKMKRFMDLSTINKRLEGKSAVSIEYMGVTTGWNMAYLIAGDRDENGKLLHVFFASRTIHDEKEREREQTAKIEEYNDIISNAGMGVWHIIIKNGADSRMQPNEKMLELLGIGDSEMSEEEIYSAWYDRIVPSAIESVNDSVRKMVNGEFSENTYLWNHPTLGERYVRCGGTAITKADGTCILSGYHYDVTSIVLQEEKQKNELANARYQAEAANRAKSRFLFNMSHDIRTPMNAIMGFTELMEHHLDDPERIAEYLTKIRSSGDFLLSLINNVLEVARIESGKVGLDECVCRVGDVTEQIATIFTERMKAKGINFTHTVEIVSTEYVYTDPVKTKEIFLNLVSNAYKYTNAGGSVNLSVKELPCDREGYAVFETKLSDTGIGMSPEYLPHLFDEFSREKTVTEDGIEGTGLGMPIVKRLVELMGGTITVESELGKGTTFTMLFPCKIGHAEGDSIAVQQDSLDKSIFAGKRVLVAEDNSINAEIAVAILNDAGFEVDVAADGIICIDMLQKAAPDYYSLILMDIQMPHMDGYKATKIIRSMSESRMRDIPIIAMTANAFDEDKQNAYDAGMDGHIAKPIKVNEMLKTLAEKLK